MNATARGYHPIAPEVLADPSGSYSWLLEEQPVYLEERFDPPFYVLSRYADVNAALRDIEVFSSEFGQGPRFTPPRGMLSDPPQHTFFRSLVQQAFKPASIEAMRPRVTTLAHELIDTLPAQGDWDLHEDFAFPLPVIVISGMLGVPDEDRHLFKRWSDASVEAMGAEDPTRFAADLMALNHYLLEAIREHRKHQERDNLIATLVRARDGDRGLSDEEIQGVLSQLLVGGNETTTSAITNLVWRLLERPALWDRVVRDPSCHEGALEESLRFDPPVLALYRNLTRDMTMHGVTMKKGSKIMMYYAAANRDPRVWSQPDTFDIDRTGRHMSFGLGVHFCLGAQLARLESLCALEALVKRFPKLQLLGPGERIPPFFLWGRKRLPVRNGEER
ncbi:MAG: cytochrome P450 [Gammaproteobacteria bacterium]|nr:cytochrome P450 [Gammaproteobacteria bacterium]